jgi:hypothetical protein
MAEFLPERALPGNGSDVLFPSCAHLIELGDLKKKKSA